MADEEYLKSQGAKLLGARLRRLSELVDREATRSHALIDAKVEQRWFGILSQLDNHGAMTVNDLSRVLRITHVSVSQSRQSLEKAGLVTAKTDPADARRRKLSLTAKGKALVKN